MKNWSLFFLLGALMLLIGNLDEAKAVEAGDHSPQEWVAANIFDVPIAQVQLVATADMVFTSSYVVERSVAIVEPGYVQGIEKPPRLTKRTGKLIVNAYNANLPMRKHVISYGLRFS